MDMSAALKSVFEDEEWIAKVAVGSLIFLIPIVGQIIVLGYMIKLARNVAQGNPRPLPRWEDLGDLLTRGLHVFVITLAYVAPAILLMFLVLIPIGVVGSATGDREGNIVGPLFFCLMPLVSILAVGLSLAAYGAMARYVVYDTLSEAFKFREVFASMRADLSAWLMLLLTSIVVSLAGAAISAVTCGLGFLVLPMYLYCVLGHGLGQIARRYLVTPPPSTYPGQPYPPMS